MGIFDKLGFKKKKPQGSEQAVKLPKEEKGSKQEETPQKRKTVHNTGRAYQILLRPITTEKGTHLAGTGRYVFAVDPGSNKNEVKKAIERVYGVHVNAVRTVSMPAKSRRYGKTHGKTSPWKKAIVEVRAGEKIPGIIESVG